MPIARVIFDHTLDSQVEETAVDLIRELSEALEEGLQSKRAKPQVMLQPGAYVSEPYRIYVDLQFRADPSRDKARVEQVLADMAKILAVHFPVPVRLRGFAIDQQTLSAFDSELFVEGPIL